MSQALVATLGADEARALTDEVKRDAAALREKLLRLYEGDAHAALGYTSWQAYWEAEFDTHWRTGYRELEAARVDRVIGPWANGALPERQARELVPLLSDEQALLEAVREARDEHGETVTAADFRRVVDKQRRRRGREERLASERAAREAEARAEIDAQQARGIEPFELHVADVRMWRPTGVSTVITDPPYITSDALDLYAALADFALDVLPDGGALVAMTWCPILVDVVKAMDRPGLAYRSTICWRYANTENTVDYKRRVFDCWKPVLAYHKGSMPKAARMFRDEIANTAPDKDHHEWGQSVEGFERLVQSFSSLGDIVCDPFLGGGTTAVAALGNARRFVGADVDSKAVHAVQARLLCERAAA